MISVENGQLIAFYYGDHKQDGLLARLGVLIIRWIQKGSKFNPTHCEQILSINPDGTVDMGSATLRRENPTTGENGVRTKRGVRLKRGHWRIYFCPATGPLFHQRPEPDLLVTEDGKRYDLIGAVASAVLRVRQAVERWFCSEIVMARAGFMDTWQFTPARAEAVIASFGVDVTDSLFLEMERLEGGGA